MDNFKENLQTIKLTVEDVLVYLNGVRPTKRQIKWFVTKRYSQELSLFRNNIEDALNHASTIIGYFDGYNARGAFQIKSKSKSNSLKKDGLLDILDYLNWVLLEIEDVVHMYLERGNLLLCDNGPTKPGMKRTTEVCTQHLRYLKKLTCEMICKLSNDPTLQMNAKKLLKTSLNNQ